MCQAKRSYLFVRSISILYQKVIVQSNGIVGNILFFGSYYTIDVLVGKQLIRIKSANNQFVKGDTVYLSLAPEKFWYV